MDTSTKTPIGFWIAAILFVLWNLFGIFNYISSVTGTVEGYLAQGMTQEQAAFMTDIPAWYASIFALAVWFGLAAAILFLLKKSMATKLYLFSLILIIASFIADFVLGSFKMLGTPYLVIMIVVILLGIVQLLVSRYFTNRGILK